MDEWWHSQSIRKPAGILIESSLPEALFLVINFILINQTSLIQFY